MLDNSDDREIFRRQRRNLIAASIITAFYHAAELTFPEINILGNKVEIANPTVVSFSITTAFFYFLWRYYTSCREVSGIAKFFNACQMWASERAREYVNRIYVRPNAQRFADAQLIKGGRIELEFILRRIDHDGDNETIKVRGRYWLYQAVSFIPTTLQTSKFSEYVLPYIIALIAILELFDLKFIKKISAFSNNF
tara:strand:- start:46173 stop:46760 length:588 start_codon:yes stop_codon:yes gene_type:complete